MSSDHQAADEFVDTMTAAIPPSMRRHQETNVDEVLRELNRIPFFMTNLDDAEDNDLLDAIKALAYEGSRTEVAENFREQGNECARMRQWGDAREFYTKGLGTLSGKVTTTDAPEEEQIKVVEVDEEAEREKANKIEEACWANRALCNLEMKNYGSCNRDCAAAIRLNPRNVKAWFRAASACLALDKIKEAIDACETGLHFDPGNTSMKTLLGKVEKRRETLAELERVRVAREEKSRRQSATLKHALRSRNILVRVTDSPPDMEDAAIALADPDDATSTLSFPVTFLYPLDAQSDFVKAVQEGESLGQHLNYILPVPWDSKAEYQEDDVECYMETIQGGLIKAGKKLALLKLLGSGKLEVVDGFVRIYVVPKARAPEWIDQFKLRRGKS